MFLVFSVFSVQCSGHQPALHLHHAPLLELHGEGEKVVSFESSLSPRPRTRVLPEKCPDQKSAVFFLSLSFSIDRMDYISCVIIKLACRGKKTDEVSLWDYFSSKRSVTHSVSCAADFFFSSALLYRRQWLFMRTLAVRTEKQSVYIPQSSSNILEGFCCKIVVIFCLSACLEFFH